MSRRRSRSATPPSASSNNPRDLERRIFVGNLPTTLMEGKDLQEMFSPYGKIQAFSMLRGFGFVQFERIEEAEAAKAGHKGRLYKGYKLDVNMAVERRQNKAQSRPSPPRRAPYSGYGEGREPRPRSRSPMHGRDSREHRDGRDSREPGREPRSAHPRDHENRDPSYDRYRGSGSREKDPRGEPRGGDPRDPSYRDEGYDRYYRGSGGGADDYYRKKDDPYREPYRDPWNGRREPEVASRDRPGSGSKMSPLPDERARVEERRRNELYRQYYEELQRRYDTERPVDCSVIVVNKAQKEYAETVGRKVRDLGMVVDLIFLNTEVSLTQALEDVGRARTPFAIIITQQHQVHRSCTVNILFGTPQEHRNMPMEDAMVLVAHNYDAFKVEHRDKEREETARKAAKMADDVLMREHEREGHPVSLLPAITLLSECRFLTPEELDSLIEYLRDKRERITRGSADPHAAAAHPPAVTAPHEAPPPVQTMPPTSHTQHPSHAPHPSHVASLGSHPSHLAHPSSHMGLPPPSNTASSTNHQQELQAKILSLFNSGVGGSASSSSPSMAPQSYSQPPTSLASSAASSLSSMMGARPPMRPGTVPPGAPPGYGPPPGRMTGPPPAQRPPSTGTGINFDNPSVQKALDTLIQSGPSLNHLVNPGSAAVPRPGQGMGQPPPMSMYRHPY